jgi:lysyl-tRNA synthetase class 2
MFVMDYPAAMCPLAKRKDTNPLVAEQWQLIVMGMEVVKCYSELTDPVLQRSIFEEQLQRKTKGDEEAVELEEDFLNCMEHGMPPMSGLGMGLDRLLSIVCDTPHIKDIVFFS